MSRAVILRRARGVRSRGRVSITELRGRVGRVGRKYDRDSTRPDSLTTKKIAKD